MNTLINKINNGNNKINNEEIINFINEEIILRNLNSYFHKVEINKSGLSVCRNKENGKYLINVNIEVIKKDIENRLVSLPSFKTIYQKQIIFTRNRFINKMVSLLCLYLIFHEIEHIEHVKKIDINDDFEADLLKDLSNMISINPFHALAISHDYFPDEIMADIEALKRIYYFDNNKILKLSNHEKILFNEFVAERLYSANTVDNPFYSIDLGEHPAPMEYINYLAKTRLHITKEFNFMNYVNDLEYNLNDIKYGKKINESVIEYLKQLSLGQIHSLNLIEDLEKIILDNKTNKTKSM